MLQHTNNNNAPQLKLNSTQLATSHLCNAYCHARYNNKIYEYVLNVKKKKTSKQRAT